jgi:hypothetical protein
VYSTGYSSMMEAYDDDVCCPSTMTCPLCKEGTVELKLVCYHDYGDMYQPPSVDYDIQVLSNDCGCKIGARYMQLCEDTYGTV